MTDTQAVPTDERDAAPAAEKAPLAEVWIDRDLGWLDFNRRVLAEAQDPHTPLLERAKFLEVDEIKTVPHVPLSHPGVKRLVGTMRREFLDQVLFWNGLDLEGKLAEFQTYYNADAATPPWRAAHR